MQLADKKLGDYALVLDLLGVAVRMSSPSDWLEPFRDILDVTIDSLNETVDMLDADASAPLFQHGDTFVFPDGDPNRLIALAMRLFTRCWDKDVLLQGAVAGGGVYFIDAPAGVVARTLHPKARLQVLVGPAVARGHIALRGVRGPRLVIDEETVRGASPGGVWRRYSGTQRVVREASEGIIVSEVAWWQNHQNIEVVAGNRIARLRSEIEAGRGAARQSSVADLWKRDIKSLEKRAEHLEAFVRVLDDDPF